MFQLPPKAKYYISFETLSSVGNSFLLVIFLFYKRSFFNMMNLGPYSRLKCSSKYCSMAWEFKRYSLREVGNVGSYICRTDRDFHEALQCWGLFSVYNPTPVSDRVSHCIDTNAILKFQNVWPGYSLLHELLIRAWCITDPVFVLLDLKESRITNFLTLPKIS